MAKIRDLGITALPGSRDAGVPLLACETCFSDSTETCDPTKDDHGDHGDHGDHHDHDRDKHKDRDRKKDDHKTKYFNQAAVAQLKQQLRDHLDLRA